MTHIRVQAEDWLLVLTGGIYRSLSMVGNTELADRTDASLVFMGASGGKVVENWLSSNVMDKGEIPVLVVPHCYRA